ALFERLRVPDGEGFDHIHGLVEATKRAFGVRDRVIADPDDLPHPVDRYLDAKFLDAEALTIDRRKVARWPVPAGEGGTVWMGAADALRLVVSYVQSLYWEFGSGVVLPKTGVLMQNRGASFSLDGGCVERARAWPAAAPYAQSGARNARRWPHRRLRRHRRGGWAADARGDIHAARARPGGPRTRHRRAPPGVWGGGRHGASIGLERACAAPAGSRPLFAD